MKLNAYQIPRIFSSTFSYRSFSHCHRVIFLLFLTSSVMLLVIHPLDPSSPKRACTREYRTFWGRWSFGWSTCDRTRRFRHDASLALRPIHSFSRDVAFPRWPIQTEAWVRKDSATEWDRGGFLDHHDCRRRKRMDTLEIFLFCHPCQRRW